MTDELPTIGYTDDHMEVKTILDISEVPDKDDNTTQIEDELDNTTERAETPGLRHLDLFSTFDDTGQRQRSCDEI